MIPIADHRRMVGTLHQHVPAVQGLRALILLCWRYQARDTRIHGLLFDISTACYFAGRTHARQPLARRTRDTGRLLCTPFVHA